MNKQPARGIEMQSPPNEAAIADYLQLNPDFFERHAALLTRLRLPHGRGETTVSLVERQVQALREKNQALESRLRELIEVARVNDALAGKIHRLACRMVRSGDATSLLDSLESSLREDFEASQWLLLLVIEQESALSQLTSRHVRVLRRGAPELKMFETLFESGRPRCGQIRDSARDFLFGPGTDEIGSAALVPLGKQPVLGLLAVGSPDSERFHPAMSTEFLARIGELLSEAIAAV